MNKYFIATPSTNTSIDGTRIGKNVNSNHKANNYYIFNLLGSIYGDLLNNKEPSTYKTVKVIAPYLEDGIPYHDAQNEMGGCNHRKLPEKVKALVHLLNDEVNQQKFVNSFFVTEVMLRLFQTEWNTTDGKKKGYKAFKHTLFQYSKEEEKGPGLNFIYLIDAIIQKNSATEKYEIVKEPNETDKTLIIEAVSMFIAQLQATESEEKLEADRQKREAEAEEERKKRELENEMKKKQLEAEQLKIKLQRIESGLCQHCGGKFKGLFNKVCSECKRKKDY